MVLFLFRAIIGSPKKNVIVSFCSIMSRLLSPPTRSFLCRLLESVKIYIYMLNATKVFFILSTPGINLDLTCFVFFTRDSSQTGLLFSSEAFTYSSRFLVQQISVVCCTKNTRSYTHTLTHNSLKHAKD